VVPRFLERFFSVAVIVLFLVSLPLPADAAGEVRDKAVIWPLISLSPFAGGLVQPLHVTHAGDGSKRLFLVEQPGRIRVLKDGALDAQPFLDIKDRVLAGGERGLLSVAFPPGFVTKGYFYVYYTDLNGGIQISRFFLKAGDPAVADPATEMKILKIGHPSFANHNGGQLVFGPDGFLYIGVGDGGSGGDPANNAQNPGMLLGKLLRIDVESGMVPYAVPSDNPFLQVSGFRPEIWAFGLRNPWRFSFDRQTGDLYIADVGQNSFEEIDFQLSSDSGGENYGWRIMEGFHCFNPPACNPQGLTLPVAEYPHQGGDCAVTGGAVYRGQTFPGMQGFYFFGDFCTGRIRGLKNDGTIWQSNVLLNSGLSIASFGEDEDGELYLADYSKGDIYLVTENNQPMPLPVNREIFSYPPTDGPVTIAVPAAARPVGVGPVAGGGGVLGIQFSIGQVSGPVDIYAAYVLSTEPSVVNILNPDLSFQRLPPETVINALSTGIRPTGVVPWQSNTTGPFSQTILGQVPISGLSPGTYSLYLLVTPAGNLGSYYLWATYFVVP